MVPLRRTGAWSPRPRTRPRPVHLDGDGLQGDFKILQGGKFKVRMKRTT